MMVKTAILKFLTAHVLCAALMACGGGGGGDAPAAPASTDGSSSPVNPSNTTTTGNTPVNATPTVPPLPAVAENAPFRSLFASGATKLVFNATGCGVRTYPTSDPGAAGTFISGLNVTVTVSIGSATMSVKATAQTVTFPGEIILGNNTDSFYELSLPSGTNTVVKTFFTQANLGLEERTFIVRVNTSAPSKQEMFYLQKDGTTSTDLSCRDLATPLRTTALNVNVSDRVAQLMQTSKDATVTSIAAGCVVPSGLSRFTYSINKNGEIKLNDVPLATDWLTGAANLNSVYRESSTFKPSGVSNANIQLHNTKFEGVALYSTFSRDPSFSHQCYP
jgi:hypothetical protein